MIYDPQKERLYSLERELIGKPKRNSLRRLTLVAMRLFQRYKVRPIPVWVQWDTADRYAYYEDEKKHLQRIVLNDRDDYCGVNLSTLLHEVAHHILMTHYARTLQDHGPEFVSLLRDLFSQYRIASNARFDKLARKHKVKW